MRRMLSLQIKGLNLMNLVFSLCFYKVNKYNGLPRLLQLLRWLNTTYSCAYGEEFIDGSLIILLLEYSQLMLSISNLNDFLSILSSIFTKQLTFKVDRGLKIILLKIYKAVALSYTSYYLVANILFNSNSCSP